MEKLQTDVTDFKMSNRWFDFQGLSLGPPMQPRSTGKTSAPVIIQQFHRQAAITTDKQLAGKQTARGVTMPQQHDLDENYGTWAQ